MSDSAHLERKRATPLYAATLRPTPVFGIDGRLLLCPILVPCMLIFPLELFTGNLNGGFVTLAVGAGAWVLAKIAWEANPYVLDDFAAELRMPKVLL